MDDLGLVETVDRLGESIVITVADAAHRRLDARLHQPLGVLDRDVLAGSERSSQHLEGGGCDEHSKAAFGSVWTGAMNVDRSAIAPERPIREAAVELTPRIGRFVPICDIIPCSGRDVRFIA